MGIGVFNAITEKTYATIRDTVSGEMREEVVEPLANYNVFVIDQQFNKNSSVSLVNTNVTRDGDFRDANVTGLIFDISNKRNTYNIEGAAKMSHLSLIDGNSTGYSTFFRAGKSHGNFRYAFDHSYADTKYDINDLGLLFRNNFNNFGMDASYRIFEPTTNLNSYSINTYINYNRLANPSTYTGNNFGFRYDAQTKSLNYFRANLRFELGRQFDYFEPRTEGRFFIYENRVNLSFKYSSNYNKIFALDLDLGGATFFEKNRDTKEYDFEISPRIRFNEKFVLIYSIEYNKEFNDRSYVTTVDEDIIFGERDRKTLINNIRANYTFNSFHGLSLTFRNYWSTVNYDNDLFILEANGRLNQDSGYQADTLEDNPNINYNTWNLDLSYSWQFAPGSFITALYRNQLFNNDNASTDSYGASLKTLFNQPFQNTFSLRIQYFIDYSSIKNLFKKKSDS